MLKLAYIKAVCHSARSEEPFFFFSRFPLHQERRFRATLRVIKTVWDN